LRELKADYNRISSLSGINNLDSLRKVSVRSNRIDILDLNGAKWSKLENLDIAENGLGEIRGLEGLAGVVHLNLGPFPLPNCLDRGKAADG
jgi:Leucine-rich repeat (LRR) protein